MLVYLITNVPQLLYIITSQDIYQLLHNKDVISSIIHKFCAVDMRCGSSVKTALTAICQPLHCIMPNISRLQQTL